MKTRRILRDGCKRPEHIDELRANALVNSGAATFVDGVENTMATPRRGNKRKAIKKKEIK